MKLAVRDGTFLDYSASDLLALVRVYLGSGGDGIRHERIVSLISVYRDVFPSFIRANLEQVRVSGIYGRRIPVDGFVEKGVK